MFPSGAALMSTATPAAYRPRSDSLISLRRYKSPGMPSCKSGGAVVRGAPCTLLRPRERVSPHYVGIPKHPRQAARMDRGPTSPRTRSEGPPEPLPHPRHASMVPPWDTSMPRPQTNPMKTIMAPVESNQARRGAMLAGPGQGSAAHSPPRHAGAPPPTHAGFQHSRGEWEVMWGGCSPRAQETFRGIPGTPGAAEPWSPQGATPPLHHGPSQQAQRPRRPRLLPARVHVNPSR